jgi:hypothetical protein
MRRQDNRVCTATDLRIDAKIRAAASEIPNCKRAIPFQQRSGRGVEVQGMDCSNELDLHSEFTGAKKELLD